MEPKLSNAVARMRQLCCAGLPSRSLMPLLMGEIRSLVPAAVGQFTWCSPSGRLANFWSDQLLPRRTAWIILHHRRYEADAGIGFRELVMFGQPTGNLRAWWQRGFEQSATYAAVFQPYGFKWVLDGVVRDAQRPYGCLLLIRKHDDPDFTRAEEAIVARVLPYLAHALRVEAQRPSRFVSAGRSALVVCSADGEVLEWSAAAHRLAALALVEEINLDTRVEGGDFEQLRSALREVVLGIAARLRGDGPADEMPVLTRRTGWGEFVFRGYTLQGQGGGAARVGLLIEQLVPIEAHLLERVNAAPLTPRQKEVALLSVKGTPNAQIAQALHISPHTLKDTMKAIYARLEVNCHQQLVERLSADAAVR